MTRRHIWMTCTAALLAVGCADTSAQVMASRDEIRAAQAAGAGSDPTAAMHLQLAKDQFLMAHKLMDVGDGRGAELKLLRAAADAELAISLTRQVAVKKEANRMLGQIRAMETAPQR